MTNKRKHEWREANSVVKWPHCAVCGIIKRADGRNKPCKGRAPITTRVAAAIRSRGQGMEPT